MINPDLIDRGSFYFAGASFLFSFLLFYSYTGEFLGCLFAALLSASLFWASYIFFRLIYLSIKK